jgi:hypothetical protein
MTQASVEMPATGAKVAECCISHRIEQFAAGIVRAGQEQGITVCRRAYDSVDPYGTSCSCAVFNNKRPPQTVRKPLPDQAGVGVRHAAGRIADDDGDRPCRNVCAAATRDVVGRAPAPDAKRRKRRRENFMVSAPMMEP